MSTVSTASFELPFKAPYDWRRVLRFLAGRATPGVESVEAQVEKPLEKPNDSRSGAIGGVYRRAIEWEGASGTLSVRRHPRAARLVVCVDGEASRYATSIAPRVAAMFDIGAEPAVIGAHLAHDPWLAPLVGAAPGLRVPGAWSAFELVVRAIVGQQVSVKAATTLIGRLVARAGARIEDHPQESTAWRFPTPAALAEADLARIGMPGKRVAALQTVARAVALGEAAIERIGPDGTPNDLNVMRETLLALPGIGPWTVEYIAMRAWRDADAWPATDLVLAQSIVARDAMLARPAAQRARTEAWRPWRAYAAMHLWNEVTDRTQGARGG